MARGRKRTLDAKRKNVVVRFQESEALQIQDIATSEGKAISVYIRELVLSRLPKLSE